MTCKAKPVEEGEYLTRLLHYIHLNPVRAGLTTKGKGMESYQLQRPSRGSISTRQGGPE